MDTKKRNKMNILITGINGFIGRNFYSDFIKNNFDNKFYFLIKNKNQKLKFKQKNVFFVVGDLTKKIYLPQKKFDFVIHFAGLTAGKNVDNEYFSMNELGTFNLLKNLKKKCKKFIFVSTQYVYGNPNSKKIKENSNLDPTFSNYSCSKINSENWIKFFSNKFGFSYVILRSSGFYNGGGLVTYIIDKLKKNQTVKLYNEGKTVRDYMNIKDFTNLIATLISNKKIKNQNYILNVSSGIKINSIDLTKKLKQILKSKSKIIISKKNKLIKNFILCNNKKNKIYKNQFDYEYI